MVIRRRLFVMMAFMAIANLIVVFMFWMLLQRNISQIIGNRNSESHAIFRRIIDLEGESIKGLAFDYTYWTEMVEFVGSGDQAWAEQNLDTALETFRCDACWVFDDGFSLVDRRSVDGLTLEKDILDTEACRAAFGAAKFPHWFARIHGRVLEFRGAPVQPSSDIRRETPAKGYFVVMREWNAPHLERLKTLLGASEIEFILQDDAASEDGDHSGLGCASHVYALKGIDGSTCLSVKVSVCAAAIDSLVHINSFAAVGASLMLMLMVAFFVLGLTLWVSMPISRISDALEKQNPSLVDELVGQKSEIGRLAQLVKAFFVQKHKLEQEVTQRKEMQAKQERLNSMLKIWGRCNFAMATCNSEDELLHRVCRIIVETGSYNVAWVGAVEWQDGAAKIKAVAKHGDDDGYLSVLRNILGDNAMNAPCVIGQSLRSREPAVMRSIDGNKPDCNEWEKEASKRGIKAAACFPLIHQGEVFALLGILSGEAADLDVEERRVLTEVVENLAAGILLRRSEEACASAERNAAELSDQLLRTQKLEAVGRLAGGIAHDFNNLLFVIMGNLELALEDGDSRIKGRTELVEAMEACKQASELTKQLLSLGRKRVAAAEPVNVNDQIEQALEVMRSALKESVEVHLDLDSDAGLVLGDPVQIRQIFMNLAINAGEAMPGGGTFRISSENVCVDPGFAAEATPGDYVLVILADTGSGMDEEVLEHAFEPFFTTKDEGTGLGLSLVNSIVVQHGGFVRASSLKDGGTTFRIFLPIADVLPGGEAEISNMKPLRAREGETILLVEDREMCRMLTKTMLETLGYEVIDAANAEEAMKRVEEKTSRIDVVLTDVVMPGMSGPEMVLKLREMDLKSKVIYMSGYADGVLGEHGLVGTRIGLLQKPFVLAQLAQSVRDAIIKG